MGSIDMSLMVAKLLGDDDRLTPARSAACSGRPSMACPRLVNI